MPGHPDRISLSRKTPDSRLNTGRHEQFLGWCDERGLEFHQLEPMVIAAYVEGLTETRAKSTVKQHLAAIRMLMDWLVIGQVLQMNPAAAVRGPKQVIRKGKTPILFEDDARRLFDSIDVSHVVGLRDRAMLAIMTYGFARVTALSQMTVEDYYTQGKRAWFILHEKGGVENKVPAHHTAVEYLDEYLEAAGIADDATGPLFRSAMVRQKGQPRELTELPLGRRNILHMVKRRCRSAGLPSKIRNHTFRGTSLTNYMKNGGTLEVGAKMAGHASTRTTQLYVHTDDEVSFDEVERIRF